MNQYTYSGPVMEFDRCITPKWVGKTVAKTEAKARSNLAFQFKKENNRMANAKIKLPGKIQLYFEGGNNYGN